MENCAGPAREDQRVRLTKSMLQTAFLQLLREKPLKNVTVKELCQRAGVNRGTFYLHYKDVYDLQEQMEAALLADLDELLAQTPVFVEDTSREASSRFLALLMQFFEKNRELCAVLLGAEGGKQLINKIIERGREKSVREYRTLLPAVTRQQAEIYYFFVAWGFIGLIQHTLQNPGWASFKSVAEGAERIMSEGVRYLAVEEEARG